MPHCYGRRVAGATVLAILALSAVASQAPAQSRCKAPVDPGWHSCLSVAHQAIDGGPTIRVTKARPRLAYRYERCPARDARRTVVVRTDDGRLLGKATVRGTCEKGVARWTATVLVDRDFEEGTVVRSHWSGIPDAGKTAPSVKLKT
jgi:hypothetical protein